MAIWFSYLNTLKMEKNQKYPFCSGTIPGIQNHASFLHGSNMNPADVGREILVHMKDNVEGCLKTKSQEIKIYDPTMRRKNVFEVDYRS